MGNKDGNFVARQDIKRVVNILEAKGMTDIEITDHSTNDSGNDLFWVSWYDENKKLIVTRYKEKDRSELL